MQWREKTGWKKIKTRQQLKIETRHCSCLQPEIKEDQNFFVIANPPGSSSILCRCCRSNAAPAAPAAPAFDTLSLLLSLLISLLLSLRCRSAAADVAPAVTTLPLLCRYAVAPAIAPAVNLLSLLLSICCRSAVAPLLLRYCSVISPLSLHCCSLPLLSLLLSLRCRHWCRSYCCSCCCLNHIMIEMTSLPLQTYSIYHVVVEDIDIHYKPSLSLYWLIPM